MAYETRDQVLERVMQMTKPKCPHCDHEMSLWEVPPINFSDGLGWGEPFLFVCFNEECPAYVNGWKHLEENYAHRASYRCMNYPGTTVFEFMPVFSPHGGTGQMIDDQVIATVLALRNSFRPSLASSRPYPDFLAPPKGRRWSEATIWFT